MAAKEVVADKKALNRLLRENARLGNSSAVQELLTTHGADGCDVNAMVEGWSALMAACYAGHEAVVEVLLQAGASPDATNPDKDSSLHIASLWDYVRCWLALFWCALLCSHGLLARVRFVVCC